jgi:hypothetical protein
MADQMRIRAQSSGDKATVRVLMSHEMETGLRVDTSGKVIPAILRDQSLRPKSVPQNRRK